MIFLDVDGVVGDWEKHYVDSFSIDVEKNGVKERIENGDEFSDIFGHDKVWENMQKAGSDFWANLPLFEWSKELIGKLSNLDKVAFLTSPGDLNEHANAVADACKGKVLWVANNFEIPLIITKSKHLLAHKDAILIDDSKKNIDAFSEKGNGYLWPHRCEIFNGKIKLEKIYEELVSMICKVQREQLKSIQNKFSFEV